MCQTLRIQIGIRHTYTYIAHIPIIVFSAANCPPRPPQKACLNVYSYRKCMHMRGYTHIHTHLLVHPQIPTQTLPDLTLGE